MAKIVTEQVVIEISRIAREDQDLDDQVTDEVKSTLEQVAQELFKDAVVEIRE